MIIASFGGLTLNVNDSRQLQRVEVLKTQGLWFCPLDLNDCIVVQYEFSSDRPSYIEVPRTRIL